MVLAVYRIVVQTLLRVKPVNFGRAANKGTVHFIPSNNQPINVQMHLFRGIH